MESLIEKIKKSSLLSEKVKEEVIAEINTYSEDELDQLEVALDDYEESMKSVLSKHKVKMEKILENPHLVPTLANQLKDIVGDIDKYVQSN